jgi:hypothetical protein
LVSDCFDFKESGLHIRCPYMQTRKLKLSYMLKNDIILEMMKAASLDLVNTIFHFHS